MLYLKNRKQSSGVNIPYHKQKKIHASEYVLHVGRSVRYAIDLYCGG